MQFYLACFQSLLVFAALGLCLGAFIHHERTCLPWVLSLWLPLGLLFLLSKGSLKAPPSDEHVADTVDWLTQRTKEGAFGDPLVKSPDIVWLTRDGIYTRQRQLFLWQNFLLFSLEESTLVSGLKPIHRIHLRLKEPRTIARKQARISFVLLGVSVLIGGMPLIWFVPRYGFRDDVLALIFMTGSAMLFSVYMALRYRHDVSLGRRDPVILLDQKQVSVGELLEFLSNKIPAERLPKRSEGE